ncbi:MAG: ATP-binding protein [Romboutsia timonensis]|uniref:ATP-binding protein n=1 Tax=Romboutsia timonensis TaxID=1776391 RepID=UPI002A7478C8|nr:ATP-binding protein [Romboutsia timonensis]MDY3001287.1 ATP-binding protein [Romboutsia timonensis]
MKNQYLFIYIHIKYKGIGISEEKLPYIFDTFLDIENRLTKISEGIGLSLSNNLVKLHNGSIQVKSEINNGSEFIVKIPNNNSNSCLDTLTYEIDKHRLERIKMELSDIY